MNIRHLPLACAAALLVSNAAWAGSQTSARAGDVGFHPATVHGERPAPDAASTMYGHPASPRNGASAHANADHPAVVMARPDFRASFFDASTMRVGHPASPRNGASEETIQVSGVSR